MYKMTGYRDQSFFIQEASGFLSDLTRRHLKELENFGEISMQCDPWIFAHYYGYDTKTLYE